jgi:hypothetical protein
MLRCVAVVRTDVSEEFSASIIRVKRIGKLGTLAITNNRSTLRVFLRSVLRLLVMANVPSLPILVTLKMKALRSSEISVLKEPHGVTSQKTAFYYVSVLSERMSILCLCHVTVRLTYFETVSFAE